MSERRGIPTTGFETPSEALKTERPSNRTLPGVGDWRGASSPQEFSNLTDGEIDASLDRLTRSDNDDDDEPTITYEDAA